MTSVSTGGRRARVATAGLAVTALALTACGGGGDEGGGSGGGGGGGGNALRIGTSDKIPTIDPAGSYDNGSFAVMNQVFPFLMNTSFGSPDVEPDIAQSAEFTSPTQYTVTLKPGLPFANGNELTASDVKFTFDRMVAITDRSGPAALLANLAGVDAPDDTTVVFNLVSGNDQTFPQILSSPAGPIVDEQVFSATELTPDQEIVDGNAFAGPYVITNYDQNNLISYEANPEYQGLLGAPKTSQVNVRYYADSSNLKLDIEEGNIDVAFRSLSATDIDDLRGNDQVEVVDGPGGEIRYIVFNFNTQPFGATTPEADPAKAQAVRQAMAHLIDRQEIADQVYRGTYTPLYSHVPDGLTGAITPLQDLYGDGNGGPDADKATQVLQAAGVQTPVQLWVQYSEDRVADVYPAYQLGWFPDYSDADNYLTPFFLTENFLSNHYSNQQVNDLILQQATTPDPAARQALIEQIQQLEAQDLSTLPYLQGAQVDVVRTGVEGAADTLDASFKFRYGALSQG